MIPIRDNLGKRGVCTVTWVLLVAFGAVFAWQFSLEPAQSSEFQRRFGLVPAVVADAYDSFSVGSTELGRFLLRGVMPFVTYGLLHVGPVHALTNMFCLAVLGMRLEAQAGWWRFAIFYLACQVLAGVAQVLWHADPNVVTVGASGSLAGVLGAYMIWAFRARVVMWILPLPLFVEVPAVVLVLGWIALQFRPVQEFLALGGAHAAHPIGYLADGAGLATGLALAVMLWPRRHRGSGSS